MDTCELTAGAITNQFLFLSVREREGTHDELYNSVLIFTSLASYDVCGNNHLDSLVIKHILRTIFVSVVRCSCFSQSEV